VDPHHRLRGLRPRRPRGVDGERGLHPGHLDGAGPQLAAQLPADDRRVRHRRLRRGEAAGGGGELAAHPGAAPATGGGGHRGRPGRPDEDVRRPGPGPQAHRTLRRVGVHRRHPPRPARHRVQRAVQLAAPGPLRRCGPGPARPDRARPAPAPTRRGGPHHQRTHRAARPRRRGGQDRGHVHGGDGAAPPGPGPPTLDRGPQPPHRAGRARSQAVVPGGQRPHRRQHRQPGAPPPVRRPDRHLGLGHGHRPQVRVHRDRGVPATPGRTPATRSRRAASGV